MLILYASDRLWPKVAAYWKFLSVPYRAFCGFLTSGAEYLIHTWIQA